jgi:hypothetical protein
MAGTSIILDERPLINYEPEMGDVKSDVKVVFAFTGTVSSSTKVYSNEADIDESAWAKMPDLRLILEPRHYLASRQPSASDTKKCTVTKEGKWTNEDTWDNSTVAYMTIEQEIKTLTSLRSVLVKCPIPVQVARATPNVGRVDIQVKAEGGSYATIATRYCDVDHPLLVTRTIFKEYDYLKLIMYHDYKTMTTGDQIGYYSTVAPWQTLGDWKNKYENKIWTALVAGAVSAGVKAATEMFLPMARANSALVRMASSIGISLVEMLTTYLIVWNAVVSDGLKSWSDFKIEDMFLSLDAVRGASVMGLTGVQALLAGFVPTSRLTQIANMALSGTKGFILATAYLDVLSKVEKTVII